MKRILLTSALVLGVAAPAFADANDFARQHFAADETGISARIVTGSDHHSAEAVRVFNQLAQEAETGIETRLNLSTDTMSVSTKGAVNDRANAIFADLLAAEDAADKN